MVIFSLKSLPSNQSPPSVEVPLSSRALLSSAEELSEEDSSVFEEVEDSLFPPHAASESTNAKHSSRAVSFFSFILIFILSVMS